MMPSNAIEWAWFAFFFGGAGLGWILCVSAVLRFGKVQRTDEYGVAVLVNGVRLKPEHVDVAGSFVITARMGNVQHVEDMALEAGLVGMLNHTRPVSYPAPEVLEEEPAPKVPVVIDEKEGA